MALGTVPRLSPAPYIHRLHVGNDENRLEADTEANVGDGYEPVRHSAYWDPEHGQRVVSVLYKYVRG